MKDGRMEGGGIEHRAARVSLVNALSTALTLMFQLISVPICLRYWGKESYGSWLALLSAFMMLRSLDGGFCTYVGNQLNVFYHQSAEELREHLSSALAGIIVISAVQLAFAVGTVLFYPLAALLGMPAHHEDSMSAPLGLVALTVSWVLTGSYIGIVHRLQIPAGMMFQAAWWAMAFQVTQFAAIMIAATLHLNMLNTSLLFALAQMLIYVTSALYLRRKLPQFYPWLKNANVRLGLKDLRKSLPFTGSNIVQQSATNGVVLVLSMLAGPVLVPVFTTVRTVTNLWTSVTTVLTTPLLPEVVRIHVKGESHKLLAINAAFWVLVGSAVNLGALLLYPLMPFLYGHWTGHAVALNRPLLCLMLASVVVTNAGALMALHLNGINNLRIVLGTSLARAILGIGVGALGFRLMGISSFGLGILIGELAVTGMTVHHFVKYELSGKGLDLSASLFAPAFLSTGSVLLFFVGAGFGWWSSQWALLFVVAVVASAAVCGWKALDGTLRSRLTGLASSWITV
jgi:O-antigen/teichoic acid export membrane protein